MARKAKKQKIEIVKGILTVTYPSIGKSVAFALPAADSELGGFLLEHGAKQRVGDLESGKGPQEKYAAALKLQAAWQAGNWEIESAPRDDTAIIIEAAARILDRDEEEVRETIEEMDDEQRATKIAEWKASPKMKAMVAKIRAERAEEAAEEADDDITLD